MTDIRSDIEKEARSALIQYAFFRWENAVLLGMSILLAFFLPSLLTYSGNGGAGSPWAAWGWWLLRSPV